MTIKNQELKIPIILNLILILGIYGDLINPFNKIYEETFSSIYNVENDVPRIKGGGGKDIKTILECQSGNLYYLGEFPKELNTIEAGQKIFVSKSYLLSKANSILISCKIENLNISFLLITWIALGSSIALAITLLNCFFTNKALDILLSLSAGYIYFLTVIYLVYF